jgi:molybdopterin synthase catalytic subunit
LKDLAGRSNDTLELPEGATVGEMLAKCEANVPGIKTSLASLAIAVNQEYACAERELKENDEIALLPPVSGGLDREAAAAKCGHARIVQKAIDTARALADIKRGGDGAAVVFEGIVRNQTRGRKTRYLEYEAYEEMALKEMETLAGKALEQFAIHDVAMVHRLGRLEIGETSVLVVVASAHRAAAFDACRWLIDTLKRTVPIWKKEYFEDGAVWADGEPFPPEIAANRHGPGSALPQDASK